MQVNQPQGGNAEAITAVHEVGDKVNYVAITGEGRGYRFTARTGVITEIVGNVATLRAPNGRTTTQPLDKLTPGCEPNALTRLFTGAH